jgi:hypothetical protein
MFGSGENAWVSITDAGTGASKWVRVRDPNPNEKWFVESVNPRNRSAIVRMDGMALKLEMITNTGEPMSIAPQPVSLPVSDAGADATAFDARGVAAEMMASRGNPEQIRAFAERMREMTPEQRLQVAAQFRQMRGGANATGAVPAPVSPPPPDQ